MSSKAMFESEIDIIIQRKDVKGPSEESESVSHSVVSNSFDPTDSSLSGSTVHGIL